MYAPTSRALIVLGCAVLTAGAGIGSAETVASIEDANNTTCVATTTTCQRTVSFPGFTALAVMKDITATQNAYAANQIISLLSRKLKCLPKIIFSPD